LRDANSLNGAPALIRSRLAQCVVLRSDHVAHASPVLAVEIEVPVGAGILARGLAINVLPSPNGGNAGGPTLTDTLMRQSPLRRPDGEHT
jgi:hypothetical protein